MRVTAIWRYPVKSMAGERLSLAEMTETGLAGDRVVQVYDRRGRMVTARQFPRLLRLHATLGPDGEPLVDGLPWHSREVAQRVEAAVALGARLERFDGPERFDILPLLRSSGITPLDFDGQSTDECARLFTVLSPGQVRLPRNACM